MHPFPNTQMEQKKNIYKIMKLFTLILSSFEMLIVTLFHWASKSAIFCCLWPLSFVQPVINHNVNTVLYKTDILTLWIQNIFNK